MRDHDHVDVSRLVIAGELGRQMAAQPQTRIGYVLRPAAELTAVAGELLRRLHLRAPRSTVAAVRALLRVTALLVVRLVAGTAAAVGQPAATRHRAHR